MASSHAHDSHEPQPMFTPQERGLLVVALCFLTTAAIVAFTVFTTVPTKQWGETANAGPIKVAEGQGKGQDFPRALKY
ncbi:MAG: hypothetical protein OHK0021_08220 [Bryobacter sp.]